MRTRLLSAAAVTAGAALAVPALAADGDLDLSFGDDGITRISVGDDEYTPWATTWSSTQPAAP